MSTEFSLSYFLLATRSLAQRELVRFYRQKSRMAGVIGSPLVFWFLIGSGLSGSFRHPSAPPEMNYLEYFFPGTIVLIILFTSIFSTMSIIEDRKEGFLQSVIVAPVPRGAIAMGKLLGGTALALFQALLLLVLTPFLGIALDALEADKVICAALGDHIAEAYLAEKRAEWDVYKAQVHEWEIDEYMERF